MNMNRIVIAAAGVSAVLAATTAQAAVIENGLSVNGLSVNGLSVNGLSVNGLSVNGKSQSGSPVVFLKGKAVEIMLSGGVRLSLD
jgi:hypothetical protein